MTSKLTITDERIEKIAVWLATESHSLNLEMLTCLRELQERRKAAMDSEPVAWIWQYREQWHVTSDSRRAEFVAKDGDVVVLPLYRHAQQPVVPDEKPMPNPLSMYAVDAVAAIAEVKGWNAYRAAMLQELQKSAGAEEICRSSENMQVMTSINPVPALDSLPKNAESLTGNFPVIPDRWIPVSERMPEGSGTYQVWNGKHVGAVPFLFGSFQCLNPEQVTHWMPAAKPPLEMKP